MGRRLFTFPQTVTARLSRRRLPQCHAIPRTRTWHLWLLWRHEHRPAVTVQTLQGSRCETRAQLSSAVLLALRHVPHCHPRASSSASYNDCAVFTVIRLGACLCDLCVLFINVVTVGRCRYLFRLINIQLSAFGLFRGHLEWRTGSIERKSYISRDKSVWRLPVAGTDHLMA